MNVTRANGAEREGGRTCRIADKRHRRSRARVAAPEAVGNSGGHDRDMGAAGASWTAMTASYGLGTERVCVAAEVVEVK